MAEKESVEEKGQRLYREGGVYEEYSDRDMAAYSVRSGEKMYEVVFGQRTGFYCDCPARRKDCSHVHAVRLHRRTL